MIKQDLIKFLASLGVPQADAEKASCLVPDTGTAQLDVTATDAIVAAFKQKQIELVRNDKTIVEEIQRAEAAKRNDMWRTKIKKQTGLTAEEIKDKNDEEVVAMAVNKLRTKGDQTNEQLQAENIALANELKKLKEEDLPNKDKEVEGRIKAIEIDNKLKNTIAELPKKLRVSLTAGIATLKEKFGNTYDFDINDKNELVIFTKGSKLQPKSKDGTKLLTAVELITETLDGEKLLENSGADPDPANPKTPIVVKASTDDQAEMDRRYPHLKKARENAEKVKQDLAANADKK